jgi:hypothetical protein
MQKEIDNILNRYTMYRVLLYGLIALLAIAVLFGFTGAISISAGSLLLSIALLVISCYVTNKLYATLLHVPTNYESWLISALILACIMPPASSASYALYTLLAGAIAISSKFLIRLHGRHIFNPVAFGAFILGITGLLPATWWIATPWLTPFTVLLALIVLRKQRSFLVFSTFALITTLYRQRITGGRCTLYAAYGYHVMANYFLWKCNVNRASYRASHTLLPITARRYCRCTIYISTTYWSTCNNP